MELPLGIANTFIYYSNKNNLYLPHMKLHKLIYFTCGWYLALSGKKLFDEQIECTEFGPLIRSVYNEFIDYGTTSITEYCKIKVIYNNKKIFITPFLSNVKKIKPLIEKIWEVYGNRTGNQLRSICNSKNSPSHINFINGDKYISLNLMYEHFNSLRKKNTIKTTNR